MPRQHGKARATSCALISQLEGTAQYGSQLNRGRMRTNVVDDALHGRIEEAERVGSNFRLIAVVESRVVQQEFQLVDEGLARRVLVISALLPHERQVDRLLDDLTT